MQANPIGLGGQVFLGWIMYTLVSKYGRTESVGRGNLIFKISAAGVFSILFF